MALLGGILAGCGDGRESDAPDATITAEQYYEALRSAELLQNHDDAGLDAVGEAICTTIRNHPDGDRAGLVNVMSILEDIGVTTEETRVRIFAASVARHCPDLAD